MKKSSLCCNMPSFISDFHIIRPRYEKSHKETLEWIAKAHLHALDKSPREKETFLQDLKKIEAGTKTIQTRGTQLEDLEHEERASMPIFHLNESKVGAGLKKRTEFFDKEVSHIFEQFYPEDALLPHHLIHVTCTGYASPSGAQKVVSLRKTRDTQVTHAYHMGCYGAFPAIQMGAGFLLLSSLKSPSVDIVHTEICSLHMNPQIHTKEQLVIESLFADGFIKYSVKKEPSSPSFQVVALLEEIAPDSCQDMSWACSDPCFAMQISKEVPLKIAENLKGFLERLAKKGDISLDKLLSEAIFAIHPGGPKIIEYITRLLHLKPWQVRHSFEIFGSCGNMSSATIPHIWNGILQDAAVPSDTLVVGMGFGPGLTFAGSLLQKRG